MNKLNKEKEELEVEEESVWDIHKIIVGVIVLGVVIIGAYYVKQQYFPDLQLPTFALNTGRQVRGVSIEETPQQKAQKYSVENLKAGVEDTIDSLKDQANSLNAAEVATSSPQVQKVLQDLKNLQNYPRNQAKEMCTNICNGL